MPLEHCCGTAAFKFNPLFLWMKKINTSESLNPCLQDHTKCGFMDGHSAKGQNWSIKLLFDEIQTNHGRWKFSKNRNCCKISCRVIIAKKNSKKKFSNQNFCETSDCWKIFIISEIRFLKFRAIVEELKMELLPKPAKRLGLECLSSILGWNANSKNNPC